MSSIPFYAKRFVAGVNYQEAFVVVRELNSRGICVTLDVLGENIKDKPTAIKFTDEYLALFKEIADQKLNCYVSIKLTMLGLDIDPDFCEENFTKILTAADSHNIRVAMDMEGSNYTERTIEMYEKVAQHFNSPEIVLQAYLFRTETDIERVLKANGRLRLCKGAYKEPPEKAHQKMSLIVQSYKSYIEKLLLVGKRVCIATHDDQIIDFCIDYVATNNIPKERFEFQMLYGMREKTWEKIVKKGYNMTVYVPYGSDWQAYYARRLTERKENVFFLLKNLFKS